MKELVTFARAIDASCARMNSGLAAVAIILAVLVAGMALIRAEEYLPVATGANMVMADQAFVER